MVVPALPPLLTASTGSTLVDSLYQDQGELNTTLRGRNIPQTSVVSDTTSKNKANISPNIKYCPTLPGAGITRLSGNLKTHKV